MNRIVSGHTGNVITRMGSAGAVAVLVLALVPAPSMDEPLAMKSGRATAVVAGGCFWGVELVFQHVRGVTDVTSGYATGGGNAEPAESVEITYDPSKITYGQ